VRALDGPLAPIPCARERAFVKCDECPDADVCGTRLVMRDVRDAMARVLDGTTLAAVLRRTEALGASRAISYSI
jgi:DNA-binding IscR family transcriptional regulator